MVMMFLQAATSSSSSSTFSMLRSYLWCALVQPLSSAQHSHRIRVSTDDFQGTVLFVMIQRFVSHFEAVITSSLRTGHIKSLTPHSVSEQVGFASAFV